MGDQVRPPGCLALTSLCKQDPLSCTQPAAPKLKFNLKSELFARVPIKLPAEQVRACLGRAAEGAGSPRGAAAPLGPRGAGQEQRTGQKPAWLLPPEQSLRMQRAASESQARFRWK